MKVCAYVCMHFLHELLKNNKKFFFSQNSYKDPSLEAWNLYKVSTFKVPWARFLEGSSGSQSKIKLNLALDLPHYRIKVSENFSYIFGYLMIHL